MIVKNEAPCLRTCLDSVCGIAGEIVIVDTGSTDETPLIASEYGAVVVPFDFSFVDFSAARNASLKAAQGSWILVLDADETLSPCDLRQIEELVSRNENAGYYFARQNQHTTGPPTVDHVVRLFPNRPDYRYRGRVHETIDAAILEAGGHLFTSKIELYHHFAEHGNTRREKNLRYLGILLEEIAVNPQDSSRLDFLAAEYHQLEMFGEATAAAERIAQLRPSDATAHLNAGIYHLVYQSDPPRAQGDFLRALELRPGYPEALAFLDRAGGISCCYPE